MKINQRFDGFRLLLFCCISGTMACGAAYAQTANLVVNGSAVKIVANGAVNLVLKDANYINNASATHFTGSSSTVKITGSAAGPVSMSSGSAFATTFGNFTMSRANGLNLSTPINIAATLSMLNGNISTSASNLLTVGTSAAVPGSVAWTAGTVIGPMKRFYTSAVQSGTQAEGIFPVGNASYNRYARVNFTANPGGGFITAEYKAGIPSVMSAGLPATINGQLINNYEDEGWWTITPTGGNLNSTSYDLILRGNTLSTVNGLSTLRIIKTSNHAAWNDNPAGDGNHVAASGSLTDFTIGANAMTGFSWFNVGSDGSNPLPVTLSSFSASCNETEVNLFWTTASEQNSQRFTVEKSRDLTQWSFVGELSAAGNSNYVIHYQLADVNPFDGLSYYRLIQTDFNGAEKSYGPVSVSCKGKENEMTVFPNPTKGSFTVEISSSENLDNAVIQLYDIAGKLISNRIAQVVEGSNQFSYEGLDLQMGTYIVKLVHADSQVQPVKVIVH